LKKLIFTLLVFIPIFVIYPQNTINVPGDYTTIQAAIDDGYVLAGKWYEGYFPDISKPYSPYIESGTDMLINFDDQAHPCVFKQTTALRAAYYSLGVNFDGPAPLDGGGILDECGGFGVSGHSPPNFLAFANFANVNFMDGGKPLPPEKVLFTNPVKYVEAKVGSQITDILTMTAYDINDNVVGTTSITLQAAMQVVSISAPNISYVIFDTPAFVFVIDDLGWNPDIIPVELSSFTAIVNAVGNVLLNWTTATEINNQIFEIERRSEESQFITIGYVEGYGTTTEPQEYSYIDNTVGTGIYYYRLKQIDFGGQYEYSDEIEIEVNGPLTFVLEQNYPNPFNPSTLIKYSVPENGFVKLSVYNLVGEEVIVLVNETVDAGFYEIEFDAAGLPSGIYFYRLQAGSFVETKKMILMK